MIGQDFCFQSSPPENGVTEDCTKCTNSSSQLSSAAPTSSNQRVRKTSQSLSHFGSDGGIAMEASVSSAGSKLPNEPPDEKKMKPTKRQKQHPSSANCMDAEKRRKKGGGLEMNLN
jgi:hypothetical protein